MYPCGSLGQSISFVFGARVGHFAATPQSDVVGIWSHDLSVMATLSVRQKMPLISELRQLNGLVSAGLGVQIENLEVLRQLLE